ncbi:288_t:CDS:2 [Paraglomus brasilianum]|uniref:p53 and DNA damage-regulated protein 1 n=1 Tax=Paraglomus brasilianum TaxID=144538 RepID=A0A9N8ZIV5_9GLOM|nr:288_t:CDS:2 [Paraglomus brasilianum]
MDILPVLEERERIADEILTDKLAIVDYDRKRNSNREALNKLKKDLKNESKVWVNLGDMFIRMEKDKVQTLVNKDQQHLDSEISKLHENMKEKSARLEQIEKGNVERMSGFNLKPIEAKDIYNITRMK